MLCVALFVIVGCIILNHGNGQNPTANFTSSELQALKDLYDATNGQNWLWREPSEGEHWNFTFDANPCSGNWQGVTCELLPPYETFYVQYLSLSQYNLSGPLPNSIEQLTHLSQLVLGGNDLHGTIPPHLGNLSSLVYLNLSLNAFSATLPAELANATQLDTLLLYRNQLTGPLPASFAQLGRLRNLLVQYNALTGPVSQAFDAAAQSTLHYVALNNNQLSGTLPTSLLANTQLQNLYLDNNCFHGHLSAAVCNSTQLQVLSLGCLHSATQCVRYPFQPISNSFTLRSPLTGTLPTCILELPSLQLLNLAGNQLTGSIPNHLTLSPNLTNILLLYNKFTGHIPESLQTHSLYNLYLSHNHFSGKLLKQNSPFPAHQYWNLVYNRLTGTIPSAVRTANSISILTGNMYSCLLDKSDLPSNDGGSINYQCGSDDYNTPYIIWAVLIFITIVCIYVVYYVRHIEYINIKLLFVYVRMWVIAVRDVKLPSVVQVRQVGKHITIVACTCAVALLFIGAPVYAALTVYYGTYETQYAWTLSFVLLSGVGPFIFGFILFMLTLLLFTVIYTAQNKHTGNAMREKLPVVGKLPPREVIIVCAVYFMVNLVVSFVANVGYVYVMVFKPSTFQVLMSLYKLVWNGICAPRLSRYMVRYLHAQPVDFFTLELYVSLMSNVIVPVLSVVLFSPRCFYGIFVPNATFSNYFKNVLTSYEFPFRYEYQCSFVYMEYYASAFIYLAIFSTFGVPVYELCMLYCYNRAVPGTYWYRWLDYCMPRILKPQNGDSAMMPKFNIYDPFFDATKFLIAQLTCLALILSLGVVSPPLAVCLAVCMVGTCTYNMLKVGRFLHNARALNQPLYVDILALETKNIVSNEMLRKTYWLLFFFSCWFMMPFLFDTLGNAVGFERSYWVLLTMPLFPLGIFMVFRIVRTHYIWDFMVGKCGCGGSKDESDAGVEGGSGDGGGMKGSNEGIDSNSAMKYSVDGVELSSHAVSSMNINNTNDNTSESDNVGRISSKQSDEDAVISPLAGAMDTAIALEGSVV